ncbi:ABI3-interacting protein 2-2 [Scenedesmus sp. NREL 46B-D3]|nr:ABI3-interacting protein 2-2 [Scenedesmus sp. NREL 46B-D3]
MTCINGNSSAVSVTTAELKQLVEKKATFEAAVRELKAKLQDPRLPEPALAELLQLSSRVATLLKTRYANPAFFRAGSDLFKAAIACCSATPSVRQWLPKVRSYAAEADAFLGSDSEQPELSSRQQTLGELLLGLPPPQRLQQHNAQDQGTEHQQQQGIQQQQQQQQQQQEGVMLETLAGQLPRAELEALLERLTEDAQQSAPAVRPPASKRTVASLPVIRLTDAAALGSVGGPGTACPVCTEELQLQERVQQLPCNPQHVFHVGCLKPWLQQDNSCPVCRQELPTDDHAYEARKEREAEEAEAQRGAAAALSHNEFMYM